VFKIVVWVVVEMIFWTFFMKIVGVVVEAIVVGVL